MRISSSLLVSVRMHTAKAQVTFSRGTFVPGLEPATVFLNTVLLSQQIQHVGTGRKHPGPEAAGRFRGQVSPSFVNAAFQVHSRRTRLTSRGFREEKPRPTRGRIGFKLRSSQVLTFCNTITDDPLSIRLFCRCHQIHRCPLPQPSGGSCRQVCR